MSLKERKKLFIMENRKELSFLEGSVFGSLIRFALPVLGALILQAAYGAVDLLVVGQFGDASSISAVGTGSTFMQMITFVITSLAMGATVTIGHHIGEQKPEKAGNAVGTTIVLFVGLAVVLTIVLELLAGNITTLLQVPEASVTKTISYIRICSGGILIIIAYNVISGILRGFGNANLPFLFVGIACVVNIIGDLVLVGIFHLDVEGAAYLRGFSADCILTCVLFSSIGYFNGRGNSVPVMIQGITSAFCIRIPVSIFMSRLPHTSLMLVGFATPITTIYGILFFIICFRLLGKKTKA